MMGKGVATVAKLFKAMFTYCEGEGTREGISLRGSIEFHLFPLPTTFKIQVKVQF